MCGIAGFISNIKIPERQISETLRLMNNRGPDFSFSKVFENSNAVVGLLHSRLSIIDLDSRSNQPFRLNGHWIIFNGEIYNYIELKQELMNKGETFSTNSDTEVLLKCYLLYGSDCVNRFEGMWSFVIYEEKTGKIFVSRDRFGEKPFYYLKNEQGIFWGSEIKFIRQLSGKKPEVNYNHLKRYLVNGHKSLYKTEDTFYREIKELPFATNAIISGTEEIKTYQYWVPAYKPVEMTEKDAVEGIKERIINSLKIRLRADVPLSFCLSGGVDSASLASIAAKCFNYNVNTFSIIDTDKRYNESDNINATIRDIGCNNVTVELSNSENYLSSLVDLVKYHDSPVATLAYFVHSLLSEKIHEKGFKISVSGTGADELFTGYYDDFNLHLYEMRDSPEYPRLLKDWETHQKHFVRHPFFQKHDLYFKDPSIREHIYLNNLEFSGYLKKDFMEPFTESHYSDSLLRNRMFNELFHEVVRVILHEDDLNSMKYSIENRSPFLDKNLFEFSCSVPSKYLIKEGYGKYLLREAMKGILNEKVRLEREKKGFNADIKSIINFDNPGHISFILDNSPVYDLVDRDKIEKVMRMKEFPNSYKKFLFNFVNAKIFLENRN